MHNAYENALNTLKGEYQKDSHSFMLREMRPSSIPLLAANLIAHCQNSNREKSEKPEAVKPEAVFDDLNFYTLNFKKEAEVDYTALENDLNSQGVVVEGESTEPIFVNLTTYDDTGSKVVRNTLCVITRDKDSIEITHYKNDNQYNDKKDENADKLKSILEAKFDANQITFKEAEDINVRVDSSKGGYSIAMAIAHLHFEHKAIKINAENKSNSPFYYIESARSSQDEISIAHLQYHYECIQAGLLGLLKGRDFDISLSADRSGYSSYESVSNQAYKDLERDADDKIAEYNINHQFTQEQIHTLSLQLIYNALYGKEKEGGGSKKGNTERRESQDEDAWKQEMLGAQIDSEKMSGIFKNLKFVNLSQKNSESKDLESQVSDLNSLLSVQLNIAKNGAKLKNPVFDHNWYNKFKDYVTEMFVSFKLKITDLESDDYELEQGEQNILADAKSAKEKIEELCTDFSKLPKATSKEDISLQDFKILIESVSKMLQSPPVKGYWAGNWHQSADTWSSWFDYSAYTHSAGYNALGYLREIMPKLHKAYSERGESRFSFLSHYNSIQLEKYILDMVSAIKATEGQSSKGNPDIASKEVAPIYIPYVDGTHHVTIAIVWNKGSKKLEVRYYNSMPSNNTGIKYAQKIVSGLLQAVEEKYIDKEVKRVNDIRIQKGNACGPITSLFITHSYLKAVEYQKEGLKPFNDLIAKVAEGTLDNIAKIFYHSLGRGFVSSLCKEHEKREVLAAESIVKIPAVPKYNETKAKKMRLKSHLDELEKGYKVDEIPTKEKYVQSFKKGKDGKTYDMYEYVVDPKEFVEKPISVGQGAVVGDASGKDGSTSQSADRQTDVSKEKPGGDAAKDSSTDEVKGNKGQDPDSGQSQDKPLTFWQSLLFVGGIGIVILATAVTIYIAWKGGFKFKCSENAIDVVYKKLEDNKEVVMDWFRG